MADNGHMKVSTSDLRDISRAVGKLKRTFEGSTHLVDSYSSYLGSEDVINALDDFAGDWKKKREKLCDGLEFLGKTAGAAAKAYDGLDEHLAKALLKGQKSAGKGKK